LLFGDELDLIMPAGAQPLDQARLVGSGKRRVEKLGDGRMIARPCGAD
jgi:hypothetical protein